MPSCSVKWCSNHTSTCSLKTKNGVSFHRFPKDETICQKWVEAVRHERRDPWWTSSNASRICSIHFKESDISSTPCKVNILSKTAVPVCTMVWYDENENNIISKTSSEKANADVTYLQPYEWEMTHVNVLGESKVNIFNKINEEGTTISHTNRAVSNTTPCTLSQVNVPQELDTDILKVWKVAKTHNLEEFLEFHSIANKILTTNANEVKKTSVLTELNEREYAKSNKDIYCKLKINDNTSFILDNNNTELKESNIFNKEPNTRTCENSMKVAVKELKSNENKKPNQNISNIPNTEFVQTFKKSNDDSNANMSNSFKCKTLKTYMPKRKAKISEIKITGTCEPLTKNNAMSNTSEKELNAIKCIEVKNSNVNIDPHIDLNMKLSSTATPNNCIKGDPVQSNKNSQEKNELCGFVCGSVYNTPRIINQNKQAVDKESNLNVNKESNIVDFDEFINHSRIYTITENNTTVFEEIISELFENTKHESDKSNNNCRESNENVCVNSRTILGTDNNDNPTLNKQFYDMPVISNLDANMYTQLNTLVNMGLISEVSIDKTDKTSVNENLKQLNENTVTNFHQQLSNINTKTWMSMEHNDVLISNSHYDMNSERNGSVITQLNKDISYNESNTNNKIVLSNKILQSREKLVSNIVTDTKKDTFTELKKHLTSKLKEDSLAELLNNSVTDFDKNLYSKDNKIMTTVLTKEYQQGPGPSHNIEYDKNIDIELNNKATSLQSNVNTVDTKEIESNVTKPKQISSIVLEEFITNLSPGSYCRENEDVINNFNTNPKIIKDVKVNKRNTSYVYIELEQNPAKDMPELDTGDIVSELNENQTIETKIQKSKKEINRKFYTSNTEMCNNVDLLLRKSKKDVKKVLPAKDDQLIRVKEHLGVVDSIVSRDKGAGFDLTDTPILDEEIRNVDSNSNNKIVGSKWIQLPADEIPEIIDDILDRDGPVCENLNLFEKVNKFNFDKLVDKKDNIINEPIKETSTTSKFEHLEAEIIDKTCENVNNNEMVNKHNNEKSNKTRYKSSIDEPMSVALASIQKSKLQNEATLKSNFQEINNQSPEQIEKDKYISIQAHAEDTKNIRDLNSEQLKRSIFEECYDPECGSNCKNEKHNLNTELNNEDAQNNKKRSNYIPCQSDNINRKWDNDLFKKCNVSNVDNLKKQLNFGSFNTNSKQKPFIEYRKSLTNEKYITKHKKIAIDNISGKYLELKWKEKEENSNVLNHKNCKRKHKEVDLKPSKMQCTKSGNECLITKRNFHHSKSNCNNTKFSFSQVMAECPECGYTTDDNDLLTYKSDVDLRISTPLSLINKDMFLSHPDKEDEDNNQNNGKKKRVALESVYAMELAYATALQVLEKKLKQKIAVSEYRQRKVDNLTKINNNLIKANILLMNIAGANKV